MKIKEILNQAKQQIKNCSPTPALDVEILLSFVLKKNREFLFSHPDQKLTSNQIKKFNALLLRRTFQEPIAYLIKEKNFYGRSFLVNSETLIPRPETELILEKTLEYINKTIYPSRKTLILDIGTGSGCILISLIKELQKKAKFSVFKAIGVDISLPALKIARKNSTILKVANKIDFLKGNLLEPILKRYLKYFINSQLVIIANLPYLSHKIYKKCPISVANFEPKTALIANKNGLDFYLKLLQQIKTHKINEIVQNLYLIFEISPEQKKIALKEFSKIFPDIKLKFSKDLAQKWRFIEIKF